MSSHVEDISGEVGAPLRDTTGLDIADGVSVDNDPPGTQDVSLCLSGGWAEDAHSLPQRENRQIIFPPSRQSGPATTALEPKAPEAALPPAHHATFLRGKDRVGDETSGFFRRYVGGYALKLAGLSFAPDIIGKRMVVWGKERGVVVGSLARAAGSLIIAAASLDRATDMPEYRKLLGNVVSSVGIFDRRGRTGPRRWWLLGRRKQQYPFN